MVQYRTDHIHMVDRNKADRTLIFIPGGPGLGFEYLPEWFQPLEASFRVVYYDPGYSSDFENVSLASLAVELKTLVGKFEDSPVGFVAHSGGALVLFEYFKNFGETPAAIISGVVDMSWLQIFKTRNEKAEGSIRRLLDSRSERESPEDVIRKRMLNYLDAYFPSSSRQRGREAFERLRYFSSVTSAIEAELNQGLSLRDQFINGHLPLLVLAGAEDRVVYPEYYMALCKARQEAVSLRIVPGAGHFGFVDQPEKYCSLISDFFAN